MKTQKQEEGFICCLCNKKSLGWGDRKQYGNNPQPLVEEGQCCNKCNSTKVIPVRLEKIGYKTSTKGIK